MFEIGAGEAGLTHDEMMGVLTAENVNARRCFWPGCDRMEPYRSYYPNAGLLLPRTERVAARLLWLATGTSIGAAEIRKICSIMKTALANVPFVREHQSMTAAHPGAAQ